MTDTSEPSSTSGYAAEADELFQRYEAYDPAQLLDYVSGYFPAPPARVLDIGSGTGRDAAWFAQQGYSVTAVEPVAELRDRAQALHPEPGISWMEDALPRLARVRALRARYDLLLLSAVWMHFDADDRTAGMSALADLAAPGAVLGMTLRHGPVPPGRRMFEVTENETVALANAAGFEALTVAQTGSLARSNQKAGVTWSKLAFRYGR